ncbi:MAG: hypothetical protein WA003_12860 [Desulfuromonadaceae bacterium]
MSKNMKLMAIVGVSALTVSMAVPALALDNEFHGMYRVRGIVSNFDDGGGGTQFNADGVSGSLNKSNPRTSTFVEQRARLQYIAKTSADLKLVTHFEIDSRWGDNSYNSNSTTRNNGGAIGADQVNLETKNVYLDFNIPSAPVNVKLGIQNWGDSYKGIITNTDAAGLVVDAKLEKSILSFRYFRFDDGTTPPTPSLTTAIYGPQGYVANGTGGTTTGGTTVTQTANTSTGAITNTATRPFVNTTLGSLTRDLVSLGGKYEISKDLKVGADYFLLYSDILKSKQDKTYIHHLGVNADYVIGNAKITGFFIYQAGKLGRAGVPGGGQTVNAFAANVGADVKAGPGLFRSNLIYASGDNTQDSGKRSDFQQIMEKGATTSAANNFGVANMHLMLDNKYNMVNSGRAVAYNLNNNGQGFIGAFLGYDVNIGKMFINSNLGFGACAASSHASDFLGTEINTEIGYKMYDNFTVSYLLAYMKLGDYFSRQANGFTADPADPYSTKVMFTYTF